MVNPSKTLAAAEQVIFRIAFEAYPTFEDQKFSDKLYRKLGIAVSLSKLNVLHSLSGCIAVGLFVA